MAAEPDDKPKRNIAHEIGQDLYLLSVEELNGRIGVLTAEIERLKAEAAKKLASRSAASSLFKS